MHINSHGRSGTPLQVFRDPQDHVDRVVASPQQQQQPLREINLNQHDVGFNTNDNQKKFRNEGLENAIKQGNDDTRNNTKQFCKRKSVLNFTLLIS